MEGSLDQRYPLPVRRVLPVEFGADKIRVVVPAPVILEDQVRLVKEGMRNVSSLDVALYPIRLSNEYL